MKIQSIRGTHDLYDEQILKYRKIEKVVNDLAKLYDFDEIITPIFESTDLFKKPLGEQSDVVLKEMYTFNDKNESSITLRPELTTPILRAAISNNLLSKLPCKLYGTGPAFRRERPQKGRYRQFNQINFEILGTYDVLADVELITLASKILEKLLPSKKINLQINSLGNKETLNVFKSDLGKYLKKYEDKFTEEIRKKIFSNPLRILDSKDLEIDDILNNAPIISDYYSKETKNKFNDLQQLLKDSSINYTINSNLVRGLDYYCHTVFEFKTDDLGSQDTLIGGGRYDGLIKLLGGTDLPGVGWAGGIERIIMLSENFNLKKKNIFLIIMDEIYKNYGFKIATILRKNNLSVHFDYKYNLKKSLSNASKQNSELAIIIGENEVKNNLCTIKYLDKNIQKTVEVKNIISELIR